MVVLDGDDGLHRVGDVEVGDGVYWDGDAVLGDHVLGFDVDCDGLQVDFHHPIDERDDENRPGPFGPFSRLRRTMTPRSYSRTLLTAAASTLVAMAKPYGTDGIDVFMGMALSGVGRRTPTR